MPHVLALHTRARNEKMEILTKDRTVAVTTEAAAKQGDGTSAVESVFSAAVLPVAFFKDLVRGHSAKAMLLVLKNESSFVVF